MPMNGLIADPTTPFLRQGARLAALLGGLDHEQWSALVPSRRARES
jgi:hypothetical protein